MHRFLSLLILIVLLPASVFSKVTGTWTFRVNNLSRTAIVYVPDGINKPPLLISMHGMGIPASWNQSMMLFEPIADRDKFIVVYPQGENNQWDLGGMKDVNFIEAIMDSMASRFDIDRNRVYASGFSMGGMMSYYLACKIPEKIAAIAPGCGYPLGGQSGCTKTRPVPIFHIHGTSDDFVKYSDLHSFLNTKIAEYGCPQTPVKTVPYPTSNPNSQSFKEYWGPCTDNNGMTSEITLISVTGMIHDWATPGKANANEDPAFTGKPFDVNGSEEAWAYLKTQSLTGSSYKLSIATRGQGTVTRSPNESSYEKDAAVTLSATPSEGWVFDSWSGDASGNQNPLSVTMSTAKSITANFKTVDGKQDLIVNGSFSAGTDSWAFNNWGGTGAGSVENGEYKLTVSTVGDDYYDIQAVQPGILLEKGKAYRLMYEARASANRILNVNVGMPEEPYTTFLSDVIAGEIEVNLTTSKQSFTLDFVMKEATYDDSRVEFSVGLNTPTTYIDNVSLFEIEANSISSPVQNKSTKQINVRQKGPLVNITFNTTGKNSVFLNVYDLNGNVIHSANSKTQSGSTQNFSFNTAGISKGYYLIKVRSGNSVQKTGIVLTGR